MSNNFHSLNELINQSVGGAGLTLMGSLMGRLMWIGGQVRAGRRRFWTKELLWELPIVFGMAFIGEGVSSWMAFSPPTSTATIAALAYLGPRGAEVLFFKIFAKKGADE